MRFPAKSGLAALAALFVTTSVYAADHRETNDTKAHPESDIADVYAWHNTANGTLTLMLTYGGGADVATRTAPLYNDHVLYQIHLDTMGTVAPETSIQIRFGQRNDGAWGVKVDNLPGSSGSVIGAVETTLTENAGTKGKVHVGLFDDPFFFDLDGFKDTVATGNLSFHNPPEDTFAGKNVMAIVLEMDLTAARGGGNKLNVWATTGQKP